VLLVILYGADVFIAWSDVWEETVSRRDQGGLPRAEYFMGPQDRGRSAEASERDRAGSKQMQFGKVTGITAVEIQKQGCARTGTQLALRKGRLFLSRAIRNVAPCFTQVGRRWTNVQIGRNSYHCGAARNRIGRLSRGRIGGHRRHDGCSCTSRSTVKLRASSRRAGIVHVYSFGHEALTGAESLGILIRLAFPLKFACFWKEC